MKCPQCWYEGDLPCWCEISKQEEEKMNCCAHEGTYDCWCYKEGE